MSNITAIPSDAPDMFMLFAITPEVDPALVELAMRLKFALGRVSAAADLELAERLALELKSEESDEVLEMALQAFYGAAALYESATFLISMPSNTTLEEDVEREWKSCLEYVEGMVNSSSRQSDGHTSARQSDGRTTARNSNGRTSVRTARSTVRRQTSAVARQEHRAPVAATRPGRVLESWYQQRDREIRESWKDQTNSRTTFSMVGRPVKANDEFDDNE